MSKALKIANLIKSSEDVIQCELYISANRLSCEGIGCSFASKNVLIKISREAQIANVGADRRNQYRPISIADPIADPIKWAGPMGIFHLK